MQEWPVCYSDAPFPMEGDICSLSAPLRVCFSQALQNLTGLSLATVHLEETILNT